MGWDFSCSMASSERRSSGAEGVARPWVGDATAGRRAPHPKAPMLVVLKRSRHSLSRGEGRATPGLRAVRDGWSRECPENLNRNRGKFLGRSRVNTFSLQDQTLAKVAALQPVSRRQS